MSTRDPAARVTAPASRRRGPASTEDGRRSHDRVLQAALDLIIEVGIDQVRLAEIARRAGMSSGQVMYYFTSKEHILLEALAWQEQQDTMRRAAALAKVTGVWNQLERFIELYLPGTLPDPSWILWLEAWARAPHNKQVSRFLEELLDPWREDLAALVARGVAEGAFAAPASDFTRRFIAQLDGLALQRLQRMRESSRKRLTELAMQAARIELAPGRQARIPPVNEPAPGPTG
jgi:AcrR family transcriptional regulator